MRKHNYLVGFKHCNQVVCGKDVFDKQFGCNIASFTEPMTILQAIRQLKALSKGKKVIYKLVEVDLKSEKFKQKIRVIKQLEILDAYVKAQNIYKKAQDTYIKACNACMKALKDEKKRANNA